MYNDAHTERVDVVRAESEVHHMVVDEGEGDKFHKGRVERSNAYSEAYKHWVEVDMFLVVAFDVARVEEECVPLALVDDNLPNRLVDGASIVESQVNCHSRRLDSGVLKCRELTWIEGKFMTVEGFLLMHTEK